MTAGTLPERICGLLGALDKPLTLPEIAALLDSEKGHVASSLFKMTKRGQLGSAGDRPKRYQLAGRMPPPPAPEPVDLPESSGQPTTTVQHAIARTKSSVFGCWMSV